MKKLFMIGLIALAGAAGAQTKTATVNETHGVFLFIDSEPVDQKTYLGTVKARLVWSDNPKAMRKVLIRKAKRKYPEGKIYVWKLDEYGDMQVFK